MLVTIHDILFLIVRPHTTEVIDADNGQAVAQGSLVTLMCRVNGARPAAVITWYNGSTPFNEQAAEHIALKVCIILQTKNGSKSFIETIVLIFAF